MARQRTLHEIYDSAFPNEGDEFLPAPVQLEVNAESARFAHKLMESNEALLPEIQSRKIIG